MPNHISNIFIMTTNPIDLNLIVKDGFSFKHVVPEPVEEGHDWYSWRIQSWGTKWDAYDIEKRDEHTNENGELVVKYTFDTAWSPPTAWLSAVANTFPNTNLELYWSDEDIPICGWIKYLDRVKTSGVYTHNEPILARDFLQVHFPWKYEHYMERMEELVSDESE